MSADEELLNKPFKISAIDNKIAKDFVYKYHYAKITPSTVKISYGLFVDAKLEGVAIWGYGVRPRHTIEKYFPVLGVKDYFELNRLCLLDEMPRNSESKFLAMVVKRIKHDYPQIKVLLSWADGLRGKPGFVYQACSWLYGGYINSEFYTDTDGNVIHPRLLITRYGTRGKEIQQKLSLIHYRGKQFIYCKPLCVHKEKARIFKSSSVKWSYDYPKMEDITFKMSIAGGAWQDISYTPQMRGREYRFDLSNMKLDGFIEEAT